MTDQPPSKLYRAAKIALVLVVTIIFAPIALMMMLSTLAGERR